MLSAQLAASCEDVFQIHSIIFCCNFRHNLFAFFPAISFTLRTLWPIITIARIFIKWRTVANATSRIVCYFFNFISWKEVYHSCFSPMREASSSDKLQSAGVQLQILHILCFQTYHSPLEKATCFITRRYTHMNSELCMKPPPIRLLMTRGIGKRCLTGSGARLMLLGQIGGKCFSLIGETGSGADLPMVERYGREFGLMRSLAFASYICLGVCQRSLGLREDWGSRGIVGSGRR
jgi:hypothetical protein